MKKTTWLLLIVSTLLLLIGFGLFSVAYYTDNGTDHKLMITPNQEFQTLDIAFNHCTVEIIESDKTHFEFVGYRESDVSFVIENQTLSIKESDLFSGILPKFTGIGKYISESSRIHTQKKVILYLSSEDTEKTINIALQDSTLELSASLDYLTVYAEDSSLSAKDFAFERLDILLKNCQLELSMPFGYDEFSREIETHNTHLTINDVSQANAEFYLAVDHSPKLVLTATGGSCTLLYFVTES